MKKNELFILAIFFTCYHLSAQNQRYYVHIKDKNYCPEVMKSDKNDGSLKVSSKTTAFNKVLDKYKFKQFKLAFPTAKTKWLKEVYYVECDNSEHFGNEISKAFKQVIPTVDELCEPELTSSYTVNDPYYTAGVQTNLDLIDAQEAWDIAKNFPKINVAITDTYFDLDHEDLMFANVIDNTVNQSYFHGTFVAGCLGATTNNATGIASIGGLNTELAVTTNWASDNQVLLLAQQGYRVINCSWLNSCSYSASQKALYDEVRDSCNTVVVFGAGNGSIHCGGRKVYPASYESCLSVTSVGHKNDVGVLENGIAKNWKDVHERFVGDSTTTHQHNEAVDICAPGYDVYSTIYHNTYSYSSGTSFAAPQVAGVAAMIIAANPSLTASEVINILKSTADSYIYSIPENVNYIGKLGTGRLNAYQAVKTACSLDFNNETFTNSRTETGCFITATNSSVLNGANVVFSATKEVELFSGFEVQSGAVFEAN